MLLKVLLAASTQCTWSDAAVLKLWLQHSSAFLKIIKKFVAGKVMVDTSAWRAEPHTTEDCSQGSRELTPNGGCLSWILKLFRTSDFFPSIFSSFGTRISIIVILSWSHYCILEADNSFPSFIVHKEGEIGSQGWIIPSLTYTWFKWLRWWDSGLSSWWNLDRILDFELMS